MSRKTVHLAPSRPELAEQIYQVLTRARVDCLRLPAGEIVNTTATELHLAVDSVPWLGICADHGSVVYCLPPQPVAAGFEVHHHAGRLQLRLPSHRLRWPLVISGQHLGPVRREEREDTLGAGELARTIRRLTVMASSWLPLTADPTRMLFELIADAWRHTITHRLGGGFSVHRADFAQSLTDDTNRLELVTNRHGFGHQLVNLYPVPAGGVGA